MCQRTQSNSSALATFKSVADQWRTRTARGHVDLVKKDILRVSDAKGDYRAYIFYSVDPLLVSAQVGVARVAHTFAYIEMRRRLSARSSCESGRKLGTPSEHTRAVLRGAKYGGVHVGDRRDASNEKCNQEGGQHADRLRGEYARAFSENSCD